MMPVLRYSGSFLGLRDANFGSPGIGVAGPGLNAGCQDLPVLLRNVQDLRMVGHAGSIYPTGPTDKQLT
jgi:hypothetical protein